MLPDLVVVDAAAEAVEVAALAVEALEGLVVEADVAADPVVRARAVARDRSRPGSSAIAGSHLPFTGCFISPSAIPI